MNFNEIRKKFITFFENKNHQYVKSAPLVVKNDPTLMFTNAGMNQFKDFFLGNKLAPYTRVTNTQKCLRVSGKHNDLEEVGLDVYHHTMFEMLGNWSFGDYFKKEAIEWAWELLTEVYGLSKDRLYVTIFEGEREDNLDMDRETKDYWKNIIPEERILKGNKKNNFWEMGKTGPCGPCSEIHIDLRSSKEIAKVPGKELVNKNHPQVIEIWNLVFMQYNRQANGKLVPLPAKHVDTGMGFERLVMAVQGATSNYNTDIFTPLIQHLEKKANVKYGENEKVDIAIRVVSDHARAVVFAICDGSLPSNNKAGYVIRRILRRAVRYGYSFLNQKEPFIYELVNILSDQFSDIFIEMKEQSVFISKVIKQEESSFLRTLENGLLRLEKTFEFLQDSPNRIVAGTDIFELYDTFGFPFDLTSLIAREKGFSVDEKGFNKELSKQKERSKENANSIQGDWIHVNKGNSSFIGYNHLTSRTKLLQYREVQEKKVVFYQLVLAHNPFYGESGGQVGDTGTIKACGKLIKILDTKKENDLIVLYSKELPEAFLTADLECRVDSKNRYLTENNHSATHLLHASLKQVLGSHISQKGSLVNANMLRFDFSHFSKMTDEEIAKVEQLVNVKIRENTQLEEKQNVPIDEAKRMGAAALFGEKYGDFVRIIIFDPSYSIELCGGTHVKATGQIGLFKILSECSVAAGVRRIEAVTAFAAEKYINEQITHLKKVNELLKVPKNLEKTVQNLLNENHKLNKELAILHQIQADQVKKQLISSINKSANDIKVIIQKVDLPNVDAAKNIAFQLKNEVENLFLVLGSTINNKPLLIVMISDKLVSSYNLNASQLVRELAKEIKGGGGGQAFFATAGGKDASGLARALEAAKLKAKESFAIPNQKLEV